MNAWLKKYWQWLLVALAFIVGGPIIINELYKTGKGYITMWSASDVLSYYGMILAAIGAAIGVFFSIKYSHAQYKEDKRRDVLPFFSINTLSQVKVDLFLKGLCEEPSCDSEREQVERPEGIEYKEFLSDKFYFFVEEKGITFSTKMDDSHREKFEIDIGAMDALLEHTPREKAFFIPHLLQNVGNGCAVNTLLSIKNENGSTVYSGTVSIPVGGGIYFGLYFENSEQLIGKYRVAIAYQDIFGNLYVQSRMFSLEKHEEKDTLCVRSWTETGKPQMFIHKDTDHADT